MRWLLIWLIAWTTFPVHATSEQELLDPDYWLEQQRQANGGDHDGEHIRHRAFYCDEVKNQISDTFTRNANRVWSFSQFKPNGFMTMTDIQKFERKMRYASEYAYKQINKIMHNGSTKSECDAQSDDAVKTMACIMNILPRFQPVGISMKEFQAADCAWQLNPNRP
ncbi:hypothetical protein [Terasakiella sp. SH-1]|uniref:hypothetical protein n=1 Tax=Terasakiella sp. SH-1 TaxID=2560057 RepID=UPI001073715D|nr:hypothetical protein [Terasakiella sp. SH-1]